MDVGSELITEAFEVGCTDEETNDEERVGLLGEGDEDSTELLDKLVGPVEGAALGEVI